MEDAADIIGRLLVRVYEIHERVITRGGGGLEGIRDATLLHAAVARPFATFGEIELYPTDFDKAAALFHSLIKSHPFIDGTKRTAFAAAGYFLHERGGLDHGIGHFQPFSLTQQRRLSAYPDIAIAMK